MAEERKILIEVITDSGDASANLAAVKNEMSAVKAEQKELSKAAKENGEWTAAQTARYAELEARLKQLKAEEKTYSGQLSLLNTEAREYGDSLTEQSAKLAAMKAQYRSLSQTMRESAGGEELLKSIQDLDAAMKTSDGTMGDFQRRVGNYRGELDGLVVKLESLQQEYKQLSAAERESAKGMELATQIKETERSIVAAEASLEDFDRQVSGIEGEIAKLVPGFENVQKLFAGGLPAAFKAAGAAVKSFSATLIATPVGWILAAIAALIAIFKGLVNAFKSNDDAGTALSAALARLRPIIDGVNKAFQLLAKGVAAVVGAITSVYSAVIGFLVPGFKEASKAAEELVIAEDNLEEKQRQFTRASADRGAEIARLKKEEREQENATLEEKKRIFDEIERLEREELEEKRANAAEAYRIEKTKNEQQGRLNDEAKNREAQLYAEMKKAEEEYYAGTTELAERRKSQMSAYAAEEKKALEDRKKAWEEAVKKRKEAADKERDIIDELRAASISLITDEAQRTRLEMEERYRIEIEGLKRRLKEEENLTTTAKAKLAKTIELMEKKRDADLQKLQDDFLKEQLAKEIEAQQILQDAKTANTRDQYEREEKMTRAEYQRQIDAIQKRLDEETTLTVAARQALSDTIEELEKQRDQKLAEAAAQRVRDEAELLRMERENTLNAELLQLGDNERRKTELILEAARTRAEELETMDVETKAKLYANEQEYTAAVIAAQQEVATATENANAALASQAQEVGSTMQAVTSSLSQLFEAAAGDSEAYAKFKKAMAIVDATLSLATTIASATAASTAGDPYTMAIRIATNVAAVTAQFAAVIAAIKSATIPSAGSFEEGGIVPGTSYSGDRMTANVNSREMILTMADQKNLLALIRAGVPAPDSDYKRLAAAVREALQGMPAPVVEWREFVEFQNRQKTIKTITNR